MELTFFGLTPENRVFVFTQIHEIVYHGQGYSWSEVYNFPIWLRKFTYQKIEEYLKKQHEESEKQFNPDKQVDLPKINVPKKSPNTYNTKATKK